MTEHDEILSWKVTSVEMAVAFVLALITSMGNLMVVIAVYKDPYKELRTISNYLVVNLAAADLIVGFIVEPIWALQYWVKTNYEHFSIAANLLVVLSVEASCLTVLFLTIERYIVLEKPIQREMIFNTVTTKVYIFLIWLTASVISSLTIPFWSPELQRGYNLFIFTGIGFFLLLIMICLYIRMFIIIRRFNHVVRAHGAQQRLVQPDEASVQARKRELEVAKAIFLFVGIFALCWLPAVVTETIKYSHSETIIISERLCRAVMFLGLLNSALNPIVYTFRMQSFRRAMRRILDFRATEMVLAV